MPILFQVYLNAGLAYWLSRRFGVAWCVAAPAALIGASNFFELAVAAAISLFGLDSGAALATVVGVLVEVPVMLSIVALVEADARLVRARCHAHERRPALERLRAERSSANFALALAGDGTADRRHRVPTIAAFFRALSTMTSCSASPACRALAPIVCCARSGSSRALRRTRPRRAAVERIEREARD